MAIVGPLLRRCVYDRKIGPLRCRLLFRRRLRIAGDQFYLVIALGQRHRDFQLPNNRYRLLAGRKIHFHRRAFKCGRSVVENANRQFGAAFRAVDLARVCNSLAGMEFGCGYV